ncbi:YidC/Oxa1 family membrane protein insertase [Streptomyces halobius]|uniref:Membrane protein insertase YidC n=1 Tax=Streptomyces halobius TaxID=2879846 RepID=A0ABY4MFU8_9ACTN|nr:YidC/Oxa1 family membrane protein insertase [Streptomyces halobius]UQA95231.1 YidC/Oxa1 family membrane protein insertase [Streptomyces halobius]
MSVFGILGDALAHGAAAIDPLFGAAATAVAIVLLTLGVRAALHPLARAAARGEKARAALAPQIAELQRKHQGNPERLQKAMADLYARTGSSPLAGCLPTLLQLPVFFVMYHLFSSGGGGVLDHTLLGAPLGGHWTEALAHGGVFGPQGRVYLGLFALIAVVATWNFRRARAAVAAAPAPAAGGNGVLPGTGAMGKLMPLLSFGTLITVAVVPLAAGLYVVTSTTWTACERAMLHRDREGKSKSTDSETGKAGESDLVAKADEAGADGAKVSAVDASATAASATAASDGTPSPNASSSRQRSPRRTPKNQSRAARQRVARTRARSASSGTSRSAPR